MLMVVYVVVFGRNKSVDFIFRTKAQGDIFYQNEMTSHCCVYAGIMNCLAGSMLL